MQTVMQAMRTMINDLKKKWYRPIWRIGMARQIMKGEHEHAVNAALHKSKTNRVIRVA